ncbi:hypothetical protein [Flavobacterium bizetiae]|uniref:hypothetical protein n=1 Tax=Flavobacterium bizetiae TaxID=2704140 RepID=UPI00174B942F|nr:hypothetical protein [Flavobacterium bizetiae]
MADMTNHSYKADKKIYYFELVAKGSTSNSIVAKIIGKAWGAGSRHLSDFEKNTGQSFTRIKQIKFLNEFIALIQERKRRLESW